MRNPNDVVKKVANIKNILRKIVKNRKNAQSFVMFDCEDFSEGRAKEKD